MKAEAELCSIVERVSKKFGVDVLHTEQATTAVSYLKGNDNILIAPTGYGKSILFQIAPIALSLVTNQPAAVIAISPLVSLIMDSIRKIQQKDPEAVCVHLGRSTVEKARTADYIFSSPESIIKTCRRLLQDAEFCTRVKAIFIDECHIIEQWGMHDWDKEIAFREHFSKLWELRTFITAPIVGLTATATEETIKDIINGCGMRSAAITRLSVEKMNITYAVICTSIEKDSPELFKPIVNLLETFKTITPKTLVFFNDSKLLNLAYMTLVDRLGHTFGDDMLFATFSSFTKDHIRVSVIDKFCSGALRLVLCTSALSVGVNIPNVEYVIHYGPPKTAHEFFQETGRAAREPYLCAKSILVAFPRMLVGRKVEQTVKSFINTKGCRRAILLARFGVQKSVQLAHCCDNCGVPESSLYKLLSKLNTGGGFDLDSDEESDSSSGSIHDLDDE